MTYLERVHIPEKADKYPGQLSGGQIIERNKPDLLFSAPAHERTRRFLGKLLH